MTNLGYDTAEPRTERGGALARPFIGLWQAVSDFLDRSALREELADLDRRCGLDTVLQDLGLTLPEMERIVRGYPEAGRLEHAMAQRLGIELETLDPKTQYAMSQTCAMCQAHRRCRRWLATTGAENVDYKDFCPNAELFDAAMSPGQHI